MTFAFLRRGIIFIPAVNFHSLSRILSFSSTASKFVDNKNETTQLSSVNSKGVASGNDCSGLNLSPLFSRGGTHLDGLRIELVDAEAWRVSSGLVEAWRGTDKALERKCLDMEAADEVVSSSLPSKGDTDFDEIEDMRIRGNLFYKHDRGSKEFEEYSFDFHRRNSSKSKIDQKVSERKETSSDKSFKNEEKQKEIKNRENPSNILASRSGVLPKLVKNEALASSLYEMGSSSVGKKVRAPTFNQLTAPYHEPFCLDIYISKGSVRACIIHRVTSKVVVVAHSISKDMKFDLASTKNVTACATVGGVLAQRALADDIHDAVYTPRKGEKLEGKLQIVLQSIIDNGINVKVKVKQRKVKNAGLSHVT